MIEIGTWDKRFKTLLITLTLLLAISFGVGLSMVSRPEYAAAAVIAALLFIAVLFRPFIATALIIINTLLFSGAPRGWPFPLFRLNELVSGVLFAAFVTRWILVTTVERKRPRFFIGDVAFGIWFLSGRIAPAIAMMLSGAGLSVDSALVLLAPLQYYALYRLLIETARTDKDISFLLKVWLATGALVALVGLAQAIYPDVAEILASMFPTKHTSMIADGLLRVTSVFGNWHAMAAFLVFQAVMITSFLIHRKRIKLTKQVWPLVAVLILTLIVFVPVVSLAGLVGMFVFLFVLIWLNRGPDVGVIYRVLILLALILASGVLLFRPFVLSRLDFQFGSTGGLVPATFQERLRIWLYVIGPELRNNLLFGSSLLIPERLGVTTEESYYMFLLLRGGIVALLGFCVSVSLLVHRVYAAFRSSVGLAKVISQITVIVLVVTTVMNLSNAYWDYSGVAEMIWLLVAMTQTLINRHDQEEGKDLVCAH